MSEIPVPVMPGVPDTPPLTQGQRVIYTFTAPSKTFKDIRRSTSWWLPFLFSVIFTYALFGAVGAKVGWQQVAENNIKQNPKQSEQFDKLPAEQRATQLKFAAMITEGIFAVFPVISIISVAVIAGVLMATINFGFAGKASFWQVFAVVWYGGLPGLLKVIMGIAALFAGMAPESFNSQNFSGTNIGYYLSPDTSKPLLRLATSLDAVTIWTLVLYAIGISIVAGVKRSSGFIAVFGWWILIVLGSVGIAAAFS